MDEITQPLIKVEQIDPDAGDGSAMVEVAPAFTINAAGQFSVADHQRPPDHHLPATLVISCSDLLKNFRLNAGADLHEKDIDMIVSLVVQALLMSEEGGDLEAMDLELDFNGMRSSELFKSESLRERVKQAANELCFKLFERLQMLQAYHRGEFPYFFDRFIGNGDLLLTKLPN